MTDAGTMPTLVVGLGCQRGCPVEILRALLDRTLSTHRFERAQIRALASIDLKREEPALLALAAELEVPLGCFSSQQLAPYAPQLSHRSTLAYEHTGCYGVAESAALALAEHLARRPPKLLVPRQKCPQATLALACAG
ncbi:cobalamin biosynthesis protein [Pseudomonas sp. MRSN 12121]|uniref:cobalamin biosynthesis protein n=1 Tax=Pseudomonas sp. MRSN 12121 TaxID=1611770 RepID=UPI0005BEE434|nr:cobalamin biosynthesis protein [Pseudomonas sp. MRSN 12121]AJO79302.1 cobalamin biosynthesis protein CobE [Pseudomonas sp. MRSN 12121]